LRAAQCAQAHKSGGGGAARAAPRRKKIVRSARRRQAAAGAPSIHATQSATSNMPRSEYALDAAVVSLLSAPVGQEYGYNEMMIRREPSWNIAAFQPSRPAGPFTNATAKLCVLMLRQVNVLPARQDICEGERTEAAQARSPDAEGDATPSYNHECPELVLARPPALSVAIRMHREAEERYVMKPKKKARNR